MWLIAITGMADDHTGKAIIMLLVNYGNFSNLVTENIIKTLCCLILQPTALYLQ